jgi:hypothetical protein
MLSDLPATGHNRLHLAPVSSISSLTEHTLLTRPSKGKKAAL